MREGLLRIVLTAGLGLLLAACNITPINLPLADGGGRAKDGWKGGGQDSGLSQSDSYLPSAHEQGNWNLEGGNGSGDGSSRDGMSPAGDGRTEAGKAGDGIQRDASGGEAPPPKETGPASKDGLAPSHEGGAPKWDL
jgi:hypothetical protein